jgi:hypothetical protein
LEKPASDPLEEFIHVANRCAATRSLRGGSVEARVHERSRATATAARRCRSAADWWLAIESVDASADAVAVVAGRRLRDAGESEDPTINAAADSDVDAHIHLQLYVLVRE